MRVTVVGAGIIGTTAAFRIKRRFPDLEITVLAEKFSPNTTSDIAAGWWEPYLDPDTPAHLVNRWAGETYSFFLKLWRSQPDQEVAEIQQELIKGLCMMTGREADTNPAVLNLPWQNNVLAYSVSKDPFSLTSLGFKHSQDMVSRSFLSFTFEASLVLPVFYAWLQNNGVKLVEKRAKSFPELFQTSDIIINCSGLGAETLGGDSNMYPISGHVIRAKVPNVKETLMDARAESWAYIIPNRDSVILGSVNIKGNYDTTVTEENTQKILERCGNFCPNVKDCEIVSEKVGLRPCRRGGVRLELEHHPEGKIIHNYGHGGSGITLCWGCAGDVVKILENLIPPTPATHPTRSKL